ncbi:MAG TPA: ribose-phosphate pyrophosphokinase [Gemmatimonadaceae bacterium]|nr:ribose-phosphate pyrophosphokinase [Gemmatimonadaceae bacterium]
MPPKIELGAATLFAGSACTRLAVAVERELGLRFSVCTSERFPDGEVSVRLDEPVRGRDVIVLAPTSPPVNDHVVELLAIADACRRADAARVVAIVPYFGYARSDRRDGRRTPIMASLVANLIERAGIDHVVTVDVHTPALEGFFRIPVDNLTAIPVLATALQRRVPADAVIVAPDLGAVRLANRYATQLGLPVAVCHKRRIGGAEVTIGRVTGDVAGRRCVIIDDMISTGGTIAESVRALEDAGALPNAIVAATHAVFAPGALDKIAEAGVRELLVTDSIEPHGDTAPRPTVEVVSIASLVATAIRRLVEGGSLRELA